MTIGMNNLGLNGWIGNQMFQYAALVGIAKNRGYDFVIPRTEYISECFEMLHCGGRYGTIDGDEIELHDSHEFCEELYNNCPNHIHLNGYFQSEKYFKDAWRQLRWDYRFKEPIINAVDYKWGDILEKSPVSISIRRYSDDFDYPGVTNNHRNLPWDYFERAIEKMGKDRTYIICSNKIDLCREQDVFQGDNFYFNDITVDVDKRHFDLCLSSKCSDHIISNSTFSWWGAYLSSNKEKRVIAPDKWYGEGLKHISTKDLIPDSWEVIKS